MKRTTIHRFAATACAVVVACALSTALVSCAGAAKAAGPVKTPAADSSVSRPAPADRSGAGKTEAAPAAPKAAAVGAKDRDAKPAEGSASPGETASGAAGAGAPVPPSPAIALPKSPPPKKDKSAAKGDDMKAAEPKFMEERGAFDSRRESAAAPAASRTPSESGLKAGWADDNAQYSLFIDFLKKNAGSGEFRTIPAEGRILAKVVDSSGKGVPNAKVQIEDGKGEIRETLATYSDGSVILTPEKAAGGTWRLEAQASAGKGSLRFDPAGPRSLELTLGGSRALPAQIPLDVVFVMDTTGSMGEEIERLKSTIDIIRDNLDLATPRPRLRFGLVLYRDRGDQYVVQSYPLTDNQSEFRRNLATASADGGGDDPEDLESALNAAVGPDMGWNLDGARLIFVVTDAPAHTYPQAVGYDVSVEKARAAAIKIHTIGTGGLPLDGEYQLRQIAQRTRGRYIFLTYGERGESEGGAVGAVSHHTGANWNADRLETIIIRFAKEELAQMGAEGTRTPDEDYFQAKAAGSRPRDSILDELFGETVRRLVDYSSAAVTAETTAAVLPVAVVGTAANTDSGLVDVSLKKNAEYFGMRFLQASAASKRFRIVERADLQSILSEWELRLSAAGDQNASKLGELLGAEVLLAPSLVRLSAQAGGEWELSVRLIRVKTGEILSISRARIAGDLGL